MAVAGGGVITVTGAVGLLLGGYIGYRECQMEKAFKEKWARTKRAPSLEAREH
jgi:hypothetical protein